MSLFVLSLMVRAWVSFLAAIGTTGLGFFTSDIEIFIVTIVAAHLVLWLVRGWNAMKEHAVQNLLISVLVSVSVPVIVFLPIYCYHLFVKVPRDIRAQAEMQQPPLHPPPFPTIPKVKLPHSEVGPALHITGYTIYQQFIGTPLRVGVHLANDGFVTIIAYCASSIGVFNSDDACGIRALQEKTFQSAQQKFNEMKQPGGLISVEIPPKAKMHFDVDTGPKILTQEMLNSITNGSIVVYFAGVIRYKIALGEQVIPFCGFTDVHTHSVPNCYR